MKKKVSLLIILIFVLNIFIGLFYNLSFARTKTDNQKKNPNSYWSASNAPLFYGTTKITIKKGLIDEFNVLDSRFRIFAMDFEDGDLTPKITHTQNVKIGEVGNYEIIYKVTDSHNNETSLIVPVIVTDDENAKINVERTLYTIPSVWNMDLAEFSRCNYGDRQILGVYLSANQDIKARVLSSENNLSINFFNNDQDIESSKTLPSTGEWITVANIINDTGYDAVPLIRSTILSRANTIINKTFKIELEYDEKVKPLDYYHYQDDEAEFKANWLKSGNRYGVIESETLLLVTPSTDIPYMTNFYQNGFTSLDSFLEYYQKVVEKMDEYVGLDFNPEKLTDQNVRTKYLVRANVRGIGAAYYAGDHVGVTNSSMRSFFEMNWGGLHELAHGYQGSLGKGEMLLGEVSNNIIGHYIQIDKSIYFHPGNWLGELPNIEEERNSQRLSGKIFTDIDEPSRLYVIINLLNTFEGGTTYRKMYSWYREQLNLGRSMTNQDAYVEAIADIYNINIIPYMEAWGLNISDTTKSNVYQKNYPLINILKDFVTDDSLNTIMTSENFNRKYSLVTNDVLSKYGITSNITLNIDIDNFSKIDGKVVLIKDGNSTVKSITIDTPSLSINNLPIGTYYLQMPIIEGYNQDYTYVQVKEEQDLSYTHTYYSQEDVDYENYLKMQVLGYNYDTIAYQLIFKDNYTKAEISYPNQSGMSCNEYIKIYNAEGVLVTEDVSNGGYFDFNKGKQEIDMDVGYVIEVKYPNKYQNKIKMYSTLTGNLLPEYNATNEITRYVVINNGLIKEDMDEDIANDIAYEQLRPSLIAIIENYKAKVTEAELNNKFINFKEKAQVIDAYMRLREADQAPYTSLITAIQKGGSPIVTAKAESLEYKLGEVVDLYSLITATDNEDGPITISKANTVINTKLDFDIAGNYKVTYKVSDSDNNVTTKTIYIEIIDDSIPETPDEEDKPEPEEPKPEEPEPEEPEGGDKEEPVVPELPDNEEEKPELPEEDDEQVPDENPDSPDDDIETPDEEPDLPVEDDTETPEEKPDLPVEEDNKEPEIPNLPENDNIPKPEIKPVLPNENNNQKTEDNLNLPKEYNNQSFEVLETYNSENIETVSDSSNDTELNIVPEIDEHQKNVDEDFNKDVLTDEIDHVTGYEELSSTGIKISTIIKIVIIMALITLVSFLIVKKKLTQK